MNEFFLKLGRIPARNYLVWLAVLAAAEVMGSMDISGSGDETTVSFSITGNVGSRTLSIEADSVPVVL